MLKTIWGYMSFAVMLCAAATKGTPQDEQAIRKVIAEMELSWNRHDAKAVVALATEDFDLVVPPGNYTGGRAENEIGLERSFSAVFKNARDTVTIDRVRFIRPDVALIDGTFEITGSEIPGPPLKGLQTLVLVKEDGRWMITALRRMVPVAAPPQGAAPAKP
jgi:uncharacterized protein (TIGR02246 family)